MLEADTSQIILLITDPVVIDVGEKLRSFSTGVTYQSTVFKCKSRVQGISPNSSNNKYLLLLGIILVHVVLVDIHKLMSVGRAGNQIPKLPIAYETVVNEGVRETTLIELERPT